MRASAQAQDKTMQYGVYSAQTEVWTHTVELTPSPELRPVDSSRHKQIKWSWESTVPV